MSRYVVDASVAAKWFFPEIHSDAASRLRNEGIELWAPDLLLVELANVLWKRVQREELSVQDALRILDALSAAPLRLESSLPLLEDALQLAVAYARTVYDSLYLALAVSQDAMLVTADQKFRNALQATPLEAHLLWIEDIP